MLLPDQEISLYGKQLEDERNPFIHYSFTSYPFCRNESLISRSNLYPTERLTKIPFNIRFKRNENSIHGCDVKISSKRYKRVSDLITNNIWMNLMLHNITLYSKIGFYEFNNQNEYIPHLFTHFHFEIAHRNGKIVDINLTTSHPIQLIENSSVEYTYSVHWVTSTQIVHDPFYRNAFRVFSIIGTSFILMSTYYCYSTMKTKVHEIIGCDQGQFYALAVSGTTLTFNLIFSFLYLAYFDQKKFNRFNLLPFTLVSSFISGYLFTSKFTRNPFSSFCSMFIPVSLFILFDVINGSNISEYFNFYALYFILHLGHFVKKSKREYDRSKRKISVLSSFIGSIYVTVCVCAASLSESYYFESSFTKRKNFELWSFPAIAVGSSFIISFLVSFTLSLITPYSRDPSLICLFVFSLIFMIYFLFLGFAHGFYALSLIISLTIALIATSGTIIGIHYVR